MNFCVKVNCFIIFFILSSFLSCEAKDWLCPIETSNKSAHEYICIKTNDANDDHLDYTNCHLITNDFNLPTKHLEVTELKIKNCEFNPIAPCLRSYENLISLEIANSIFESLDSVELNHKFLKKLNVSHNKISEIPFRFLSNIPEIRQVDLSHNNIEDIKIFQDAYKLRVIDLSYNKIVNIYPVSFVDLKDLEYLNLSNNRIDRSFGMNFILNKFLKLKELHFKSNPFDMYWDMEGFGQIQIVPNSSDVGFFRTSSEYIEFRCNEQTFEKLNFLRVEPNKIDDVHKLFQCFGPSSALEVLDLSGTTIVGDSAVFLQFPRLVRLRLRDTQLKSFDFAMLDYLSKLKELDISKNRLKVLSTPMLSQNLVLLNIADNEIENIPETIDSLSSSIEKLDLSGNFVGDISRINLGKFRKLKQIGLRNTSLRLTDSNPFEQNEELTHLSISENDLSKWNFSTMAKSLYNLERFFAAGCRIGDSIEVIKLLGPKLERIDLSNNILPELKTSQFKTDDLLIDSLANMSMTKFEMDSELRMLDELNISFNQLMKLNFTNLTIKEIDIQGNNLTELINFDELHLPYLSSLNIANNNFSCEYLVQLLERIKIQWHGMKMIGDPYEQKHGQDCHPNVKI